MKNTLNFKQVDVFTKKPFKGNPVAVVMDAQQLSSKQMQAIARWTNLSETTFVLPAKNSAADYQVRIFTPESELPFAGHPTIGTAYALLESELITVNNGTIIQECGSGLINLIVSGSKTNEIMISFELPPPTITSLSKTAIEELENALRCRLNTQLTPVIVDVGARWIVANIASVQELIDTEPDFSRLYNHNLGLNVTGVCLYGNYEIQERMNIEVRSFAPACGVNEDPVCGSGNGSVAAFMRHYNVTLPLDRKVMSFQGKVLERDGRIQLSIENNRILVSGNAVTCISGEIIY